MVEASGGIEGGHELRRGRTVATLVDEDGYGYSYLTTHEHPK